MSYREGAANGQYRGWGAEGCVVIEDKCDWTPEMIDEMLAWALEEGKATFLEEGIESSRVVVVEFSGRPQEVYSPNTLRRSLQQYIAPAATPY